MHLMGLFDFLKPKKEKKVVEIFSPLAGTVIGLEEVPDDAFAQKMIGDGCAIDPAPGAIYAPVDGDIDIFETNHAVSIESPSGLEMIIHFGVDTVKLNKEGLTGAIYAPVDGDIDIFETNHAVSIESPSGLEMIIHFGVDTVKLNKEGLTRVAEGGGVKKGDKLVEYDLELVKSKAPSVKTPIIITNMDMVESIEVVAKGQVKPGDLLMRVTLK